MAGAWLGPLLMFWLYVWGPLRPFHYPDGDVAPSPIAFGVCLIASLIPWWLPASCYRIRSLERGGRLYEALGVRMFRFFVPDGDLANRWRRRRQPGFRVVTGRRHASAFIERTRASERGHAALFLAGILSALFAWRIGWHGWALYLSIGNIVVNVYPIFLQRYTRARLERIVAGT